MLKRLGICFSAILLLHYKEWGVRVFSLIGVLVLGWMLSGCISDSNAQDSTNPDLKVLARNVILEKVSGKVNLEGTVQAAFKDLVLPFEEVIIGRWQIENRGLSPNDAHLDTGEVLISSGGAFDLISGSFAAIGMGAGEGPRNGICDHKEDNQVWEVLAPGVVLFSYINPTQEIGDVENRIVPRVISVSQNEVVLVSSSGCGALGFDRVSILRRSS